MYEIQIESEEFKEKRTVQQHQMVNQVSTDNSAPLLPVSSLWKGLPNGGDNFSAILGKKNVTLQSCGQDLRPEKNIIWNYLESDCRQIGILFNSENKPPKSYIAFFCIMLPKFTVIVTYWIVFVNIGILKDICFRRCEDFFSLSLGLLYRWVNWGMAGSRSTPAAPGLVTDNRGLKY